MPVSEVAGCVLGNPRRSAQPEGCAKQGRRCASQQQLPSVHFFASGASRLSRKLSMLGETSDCLRIAMTFSEGRKKPASDEPVESAWDNQWRPGDRRPQEVTKGGW